MSSAPLADCAGAAGESGIPDAVVGPVYSSVSALRAAEIMAFGPVSTADLSQALCCHERTARRVLERLVDEGWAHRMGGPRRRYSLSLRAAAMGAQALSRSTFAAMAAGLVGNLAARSGRAVFVAVPCYDRLLCIAGSDDAAFGRGDLLAIAGSAAGLLLLAHRAAWRGYLSPAVAGDERKLVQVRTLGQARVGHEVAVPLSCDGDGVLGAVTLAGVKSHEVAVVELARALVADSCSSPVSEAA